MLVIFKSKSDKLTYGNFQTKLEIFNDMKLVSKTENLGQDSGWVNGLLASIATLTQNSLSLTNETTKNL